MSDQKKKGRSGRARTTGVLKSRKPAPKMSGLVLAALRSLRDARGSTAKEIMKYIMAEYNTSEAVVQRQLKTALKRGVEYGILKKTNNGYSLNTDAEVIGPLDLTQMDACKKKRASCPPKRTCKRKKKPRRKSCPRKKRKRNPCNVCASRGRRSDCSQPVRLLRDVTPTMDDETNQESDKRSLDDDDDNESNQRGGRSRSNSRARGGQQQQQQQQQENSGGGAASRSRSPSAARYSASDDNMDDDDDDV